MMFFGLLFLAAFLFGCVNINVPDSGAAQQSNKSAPRERTSPPVDIDVGGNAQAQQGREVSGNVGETLSSGVAELTVHNFEYASNLDNRETIVPQDGKYVVLNVTVKNVGDAPFSVPGYYYTFAMLTSLTDREGSTCNFGAAEVMPQAFVSGVIAPGQEKRGLVACEIPIDTRNLKVKFDTITVDLFRYADVESQLSSSGPRGEFVSNPYSAVSIRLNDVSYVNVTPNSNGGSSWKGVTTNTFECGIEDAVFGGTRDLGTGAGYCKLIILNLTVRRDTNLPWTSSYNLGRFNLQLGQASSQNRQIRAYNAQFYDVLDDPLDLNRMAFGEERTGQIVYHVGEGVVIKHVPIKFFRQDFYSFGQVSTNVQ